MRNLGFIVVAFCLLVPSVALAQWGGTPESNGRVLSDPTGSPVYQIDGDTDGADTRMRPAAVLVLPDATGGTAIGPANPLPVQIPAGFPAPVTAEGVVAEGAAASTADPLIGGTEARALTTLPAVLAGQAARLRGTLVGSLWVTLTDAAGTVTPIVADGGIAGGLVQIGGWTGAASVRALSLGSGALVSATLDGAGNAISSVAAGLLRPLHTLSLDAAGAALFSAASPGVVSGTVAATQSGAWSVTADTELPAAAALADTTGTPTPPAVGAFGMFYNGGTWDMMRGTVAGGLLTNTELAVPVALSDIMPNPDGAGGDPLLHGPAVPSVGSHLLGWYNTGGTWDRIHSESGRLAVSLSLVNGGQPSTGPGGASTYALRIVHAQPDGPSVPGVLTAADQTANAAIAGRPTRANILVQSAGTTACLVSVGAATGGTAGVILSGGTSDDDGTGGHLATESVEAIWVYDLSGVGTCKFRYIEEVW